MTTVYVAGGGGSYHRFRPVTCGGIASRLDASEIEEKEIEKARQDGLTECSVCW